MTAPKTDPEFGHANVKVPEIPKRPLSWRSTEFFATVVAAIGGMALAAGVDANTVSFFTPLIAIIGGRIWSKFNPKTTK